MVVLHGTEKMARIQQSPARMLPPNQRLNAPHFFLIVTDVDLGQIFEYQFVLRERALEFAERNRRRIFEIWHQEQFDGDRVERSSSDSDHSKPLCFRVPPRAGKTPAMDAANS